MTEARKTNIGSEAEFLAHLIALKLESEERLLDLSHCLAEHHNPEASKVFADLAGFISRSLEDIEAHAVGHDLPVIPPWEYQWHCADAPESLCIDQAHYMMTGKQSLELALYNEQHSILFLKQVKADTDDPRIEAMAQRFIETEQRFVQIIQQSLDDIEDDIVPHDDLDPPNMPE